MRIGLIGCGNMGGALLTGLVRGGAYSPADICVFDAYAPKLAETEKNFGVKAAASAEAVAAEAEILIVAVKPQDMDGLIARIRKTFDRTDRVLLTIAAGIRVSSYRDHLTKTPIARVMPNTPALVGEGASAVYFDGEFSEDMKNEVLKILSSCGIAEVVSKEGLLDTVTGLSGSAPAYVFSFINALADAGVQEGLPRAVARKLAVQTVLGSAKLALQDSGTHPLELRDRVTSPGGTTAAGLFALEEGAFNATVIRAVVKATEKSRELGGGK
jgi:pyrroline-5-carboxylate reductase